MLYEEEDDGAMAGNLLKAVSTRCTSQNNDDKYEEVVETGIMANLTASVLRF